MRFLVIAMMLSAGAAQAQYLRGINLSGAEWGENTFPGTLGKEYTFHSERSYQYWPAKALPLVRLPFRWERLQPVLSGPLDADYLELLKQSARWAAGAGVKLIIEPHNFGRYKINEDGRLNEYIIDHPAPDGRIRVSQQDLADFWVRVSQEFQDDPGVHAYDLMNEPHDMGQGDWRQISQTAVNAIRGRGDGKLILVPGNAWSSAEAWPSANGASAWILDPLDNFKYETHCYFDRDNSGSYARGYDEEAAVIADLPNVGRRRVGRFLDWCQANNVRGYVGEFGAPPDDARWLDVIENFLQAVDAAGMDATYWAAGEWWETYKIGIQPLKNFTVDRPQVALLQKHLPAGWVSTNSAASGSGNVFAPASPATARGDWPQSPETTEVELTDATGAVMKAQLMGFGETDVMYQIPAEFAPGLAQVRILNSGEPAGTGVFSVAAVAPALFQYNGDAMVSAITEDGRTYLVFDATGVRNVESPDGVSLRVAGRDLSVAAITPDETRPGFDLVKVELPAELIGTGDGTATLTAGGKTSNEVHVWL